MTVFQKIIDGEIPADIVYSDEKCLAFRDIQPRAPVHVLVIPRKPIATLNDLAAEDLPVIGHIYGVIRKVAEDLGVAESGYRVVVNCGRDGGQEVMHVHFHVLAGRKLEWPPG